MRSFLPLLLAAAGALASPTVTLTAGVVVGTNSASMDNFRGIPFAMPPTGSRRLKSPVSYTTTYPGGTFNSVPSPTACPQFIVQVNENNLPASVASTLNQLAIVQSASNQGEDCLTLNVQRPQNLSPGSNLPVVVWFYGGGFESGATSQYDGANLVVNSISINNPIIFVEMNYRVNGFGFLAGSQLSNDGSTNLGLKDQRLALQWVQDNIYQFGGDPTKVTLFGNSAGAISVFDQMIINGGNNAYSSTNSKPLFRGAIMDSGSVIPAQSVTSLKAQNIFNTVASAAGCSPSASNVLDCLRAAPYSTFLNAVQSVPSAFGYRSLDLSYLPRPDSHDSFFSVSPEQAVLNGKYAKVPIIIGDQEDEGTLFSLAQSNITTDAQLKTYLASFYTTASATNVNNYINTYPDDPTAGSPYRTGNNNNIYPEFKRLAAILGDAAFNFQRRLLLNSISGNVKCWSYIASYLYNLPVLGTFHSIDTNEVYNDFPNSGVAASIQTFYTGFIVNQDPNSIQTASTNQQNWNQYTTSNLFLLNFTGAGFVGGANGVVTDNYRSSSYNVLQQNWANFLI